MDNAYRRKIGAHGGIQIVVQHAQRLNGVHTSQIHFTGHGGHLHLPAGMGRTASLGLVGIFVFQQIDLICLGIEFQNTRLELIGAVLVDSKNTGLGAQLQQFHRIAHHHATFGLRTLGLGLGSANLLLHLIQGAAYFRLPLIDIGSIRTILQLLSQSLQLFGCRICRKPGILNDLLSLPTSGLHSLVLLLLELDAELLALLLDFFGFALQMLRFHTCGFHLLPLLLQLGQYILKVLIALAHQIVSFFQNILRKTQFPGDGKGIGLSGNANQQLIGRPQALHVKLTGRIDNALGSHGVELKFGVVGGRHHPALHLAAEFDDCHSQCRTFRRVGTGAQLVKQHQRPVVTLIHHIHNGLHVAGESGQALSDGLFVANIRQNRVKCGQNATIPGRNMQPALCHQCQQANGFQSNRLAAGIGAGDDHGVKIRAQPHRNRHHFFRIDQRMPGVSQFHLTLIVHDGRPCPHPIGQLRLGKDHVQLHQHSVIQIDVIPMCRCLSGKLRQNPLDLLFLLQLQFTQRIVGVHSRHGLNKEGRTRSRHIMHQTRHISPALTLNRHHIPSTPDGDDGLP